MTDDPELVVAEHTEEEITTEPQASAPLADAPSETIADTSLTDAAATEDQDDSDGNAPPPEGVASSEDDAAASTRRRFPLHMLGTLLIAVGIVTILVTVGIIAWSRHRSDAETQAFLSRVSTPTAPAAPVILAGTTPFPSTISGAQVPDTLRTPTANVATRAAQPVATTTNGVDRAIVAVAPPPTAVPTPVAGSPGAGVSTPAPPPTPKPRMPEPTHLMIPAIKVNSDIIDVGVSPIEIDGQQAYIWDVAPYAVGHHFSSANPGEGENVVLSGHDDWEGEVFKNLYKLKKGDEIMLQAGDRQVGYHVDDILLLPEVGESLEKRIANATFIGTTGDERLTLVTCWPYGVDDHRLIIIARPDK